MINLGKRYESFENNKCAIEMYIVGWDCKNFWTFKTYIPLYHLSSVLSS